MMALRKAKRRSLAFEGFTYSWKSQNWSRTTRKNGAKGRRKRLWWGWEVSSVQDQENTAIVEIPMRETT